jgi:hypothetical protein
MRRNERFLNLNMNSPDSTKRYLATLAGCAFIGLLAGCATSPLDPGLTGPFHKIGNYYLINHKLPSEIRRVAMLPLTASQNNHASGTGREAFEPVLYGELTKSRVFELVRVSTEKMEQWTGKIGWSSHDELPADFLAKIREQTGCDAILFSELSFYRPYPPVAIGWRLLLVKSDDGQVLWSVDEIFDSGEPRIMNSARRFALENERTSAELSKEASTRHGPLVGNRVPGLDWLTSPTQFARFAANAAVETLTVK